MSIQHFYQAVVDDILSRNIWEPFDDRICPDGPTCKDFDCISARRRILCRRAKLLKPESAVIFQHGSGPEQVGRVINNDAPEKSLRELGAVLVQFERSRQWISSAHLRAHIPAHSIIVRGHDVMTCDCGPCVERRAEVDEDCALDSQDHERSPRGDDHDPH